MSKEVMWLTRVRFSELHEVEGAFGQEQIAVAGGSFPKYLIHSYDLKAKTVIFPMGWGIRASGGTSETNWKRTHWWFDSFIAGLRTVLQYKYVKKIDSVEVECDMDEFRPDKKLAVMTLRVPRRNKNRTDKLIEEYRTARTVFAVRSRESKKITKKPGRKERIFPQYLYELAMRKSKCRDFAQRLYVENLVPKRDRFAILVGGAGVFPRQLAYFKNSR